MHRFVQWAAEKRIPGWYRFWRLYNWNSRAKLQYRTVDGVLLFLDPKSHVDGRIIQRGYYERAVLDAVVELLPERGVFWDVGANLGLHCLSVAKLREDAVVVAFEPAPAMQYALAENAKLNNAELLLFPLPLSNVTGITHFSIAGEMNAGLGSLTPWADISYPQRLSLLGIRADDAVRLGLPSPAVIKMDVEGAEFLVLMGLGHLLESVQAIILECDPVSVGYSPRFEEIRSLLKANGFDLLPLRRDSESDPVNLLACRGVSCSAVDVQGMGSVQQVAGR